MNVFGCPFCRRRHVMPLDVFGKTLWCSCGLLLKIGLAKGTVSRPRSPKLVEHPQGLEQCYFCFGFFPSVKMVHTGRGWLCDECTTKEARGERPAYRIEGEPLVLEDIPMAIIEEEEE